MTPASRARLAARRQRRSASIAAAALALAGAAGVLWVVLSGTGSSISGRQVATASAPPSREAASVLFAPTSFWNQAVASNAALDPGSTGYVSSLVGEVQREETRGNGPWIASVTASTPIYVAQPGAARVRVHLDAAGVVDEAALQQAFESVPIPAGAEPAEGPDRHLVVYQPSTDSMWEMFKAVRLADGWHAKWGGAMQHVSQNPGYYTPAAWPGAWYDWGATASSLPVAGGVMLLREMQGGEIDHALALNLPAPRAHAFAWPAQRSDGTGPPDALPEGAHLRLDPHLDVDRLNLPPLVRAIARAAQRYGLVVRDQTHNGISLFAEDPGAGHTRVLDGPGGVYGGLTPLQLLSRFPWDRLQVLRMHLCTRTPCA